MCSKKPKISRKKNIKIPTPNTFPCISGPISGSAQHVCVFAHVCSREHSDHISSFDIPKIIQQIIRIPPLHKYVDLIRWHFGAFDATTTDVSARSAMRRQIIYSIYGNDTCAKRAPMRSCNPRDYPFCARQARCCCVTVAAVQNDNVVVDCAM